MTIEGVLTTRLGAFDSGRGAFVQDSNAGIALYLSSAPPAPLSAGTRVRATGVVSERYAERTLRADPAAIAALESTAIPDAHEVLTGGAAEQFEGLRVAVAGTVTEAPDALTDGTGLWLDDGSGRVRVVVTPAALDALVVRRGSHVLAIGPLGQRASGTSEGYRVMATEPGDLVLLDPADPDPSASPTASATSTSTTRPPTAEPSASATATPSDAAAHPDRIADVRAMPVGRKVTVAGIVTASAGMLSTGSSVSVQDETGAIFVSLPAPLEAVEIGTVLTVGGSLAAPYGQLEIRSVERLEIGPQLALPSPLAVSIGGVREALEARLVVTRGRVESVAKVDGRVTAALKGADGTLPVYATSATGVSASDLPRGAEVEIVGIVGQRASATGRQDGYRLWIRGPDDVSVVAGPSASGRSASASSSRAASHPPVIRTIRQALGLRGDVVQVDGVVSAQAGLVESGTRMVVIDDGTAAIGVLYPATGPLPMRGDRVRIVGTVGSWHTGARIVASSAARLGSGGEVVPVNVHALGPAVEWRLVRITGAVDSVTHLGARWRAVVESAGQKITLLAEPVAQIAADGVTRGRTVTAVGIVRRSPSSPQTFQVLLRDSRDLTLGREGGFGGAGTGTRPTRGASIGAAGLQTELVEIADLPERLGQRVAISGIVTVQNDAVALFDGTATAQLVGDEAQDDLALLEPGDAVQVDGTVVKVGDAYSVRVQPGGIVQLAAAGLGAPPSPEETRVTGVRASATMKTRADDRSPAAAGAAAIAVGVTVLMIVALGLWRRRWRTTAAVPGAEPAAAPVSGAVATPVWPPRDDEPSPRGSLVAPTLDAQE